MDRRLASFAALVALATLAAAGCVQVVVQAPTAVPTVEGASIPPAISSPQASADVAAPSVAAPSAAAPSADTGGQPASGAVTTLDGVKSATIQIESDGSFVDPAQGQLYNVAGRGSGVIIDPSGLALTANHVVTGAAAVKVWIGGDRQNVHNARVVATSECSDLALIQIDGTGLPYVAWFPDAASPGLEVYAAGFPLGDPEYTLTRGIVSKADADGETSWSSVDAVIEHDALLNPGNSGGPLVTKDGQLVGIDYAGNDVGQYFAIGKGEADRVLAFLKAGSPVTWIGVNGQAVSDGSITGIWVAAVESGSPADVAGIRGGDVILTLEGLVLATDGTMSDYCDVLRSRKSTDTMTVEVLRPSTGQILEGQLNGRMLQ